MRRREIGRGRHARLHASRVWWHGRRMSLTAPVPRARQVRGMLQRLPAGANEAPRMAALAAAARRLAGVAAAQRARAVPRPEPPQYGALLAAVCAFAGAPAGSEGAAPAAEPGGALGSVPRVLALLAALEARGFPRAHAKGSRV